MCDSFSYDDGPQFWDSRRVKARKAHQCSECRQAIQVGDSYQRVSALFDGDWERFSFCAACHALQRAFAKVEKVGFLVGAVRMQIIECARWHGGIEGVSFLRAVDRARREELLATTTPTRKEFARATQ